ncbi:MAG: septal ring lytic transglycosylase RlpA family protein [Rhodoblastus sp.]|nr:MAG: septal ring lytic transglycosylase RlpA family protein [Rhodoblastus sp.]
MRPSVALKVASAALAFALVSGCAQQQQRGYSGGCSKEYFGEGKYGKASPRVVQLGESVPKGGGRYLIGRPYRIAGRTYVPSEKQPGYSVTGTASWYGAAFHGRRTANGEIYDMASITAAHPTMPLPSYARVTNLKNGKSIVVRVNDRGPYHGGRVMDMSSRVADLLDFKGAGTARVKVDYLGKAGLGGSDDRQLAATLSTGAPAQLAGYETPVEASAVAATDASQDAPRAPEPKPARRASAAAACAAGRGPRSG